MCIGIHVYMCVYYYSYYLVKEEKQSRHTRTGFAKPFERIGVLYIEQQPQKIPSHFLQWCLLRVREKGSLQAMQHLTSSSGIQPVSLLSRVRLCITRAHILIGPHATRTVFFPLSTVIKVGTASSLIFHFPTEPYPKAYTQPSDVTAVVYAGPQTTCLILSFSSTPPTGIGVEQKSNSPLPSWPRLPSPHVQRRSSSPTAARWQSPLDI